MKLNYKRTMLVGLAFFSISAFWLMYDNYIPLILEKTFDLQAGPVGIIMAIDNILALILLPVFGALSDKAGRRMPFILIGTFLAAGFTVAIPLLDKEGNLIPFMVVLGLVLLSMSFYRSPAVALMPDVTPKPLRSKGNAIINLMGSFGGIFTLVSSNFLIQSIEGSDRKNYLYMFVTIAALMVVSVLVLFATVNEKKCKEEMVAINYGVDPEDEEQQLDAAGKSEKLSPAVRRSLILILCSVALWFTGYNAVATAFTRYAENVWGLDAASGSGFSASWCLLIGQGGAIISYLPIGILSSKLGRKRTILLGAGLLTACLLIASMLGRTITPVFYVIFALVGFSWAAINVNSFPMVVEISKSGDIGKYTGLYYTFSMAAQVVTPIVSGFLIQVVSDGYGIVAGYSTLFPYAAFFLACSFVTMCFVKHGDIKPIAKKSALEAFDVDD